MTTYAVPVGDPAESELLARLHHDSRRLIEIELRRLSRRVPTLDAAELAVVGEALAELTDALILDRLRRAPSDAAPQLCRLFGSLGNDDEAGIHGRTVLEDVRHTGHLDKCACIHAMPSHYRKQKEQ